MAVIPQSKVIELMFDLNETNTNLLSRTATGEQFNTSDTDAWLKFEFDDPNIINGTYSLVLHNLLDDSVFNHADVEFTTNPFYYKLDSSPDILLNEIRHSGTWDCQLVITLENRKLTTKKFQFNIDKHILDEDGVVDRTTLLEDYTGLMTEIGVARDSLNNLESTYAPRLFSAEQQLEQKANTTALNVEKARIDSFTTLAVGSTTGDAELIDGRVGADGKTYANIGGAIRGQVGKISDKLVKSDMEYKPTITWQVGYISYTGTSYNTGNFTKSSVITVPAGYTVFFKAQSYLATVAVIAAFDGTNYIPLVVSTGSEETLYSYNFDAETDIVLSYLTAGGYELEILFNPKARDQKIYDTLSEVGVHNPLDYTWTKGAYIAYTGTYSTAPDFKISSPISLKKGERIDFTSRGYLTNAAMIALYTGSAYIPVVISIDSTDRTYSFTAVEDCTVVLSCNRLYATTVKKHFPLWEKVNSDSDTSLVWQEGYVSYTGVLYGTGTNFKMTEPITFKSGVTVNVLAQGYNTSTAIIAEKVGDKYYPLVNSLDSTLKNYTYTFTHDTVVVFSTAKATLDYAGITVDGNGVYADEDWTDYINLSVFPKFGVVGDSFASGATLENAVMTDHYNTSWGQIMARNLGTVCTNFSQGGLSTRSWLATSKGLELMNNTAPQDIYYLALGINDAWSLGAGYLGTIADINDTDYTLNADTFYGNYGKIIAQIKAKAPKAKLIMFTMADNTGIYATYNTAIIAIAARFGIPCLMQYDDYFFQSPFYRKNMVSSHPIAIVYSGMANAFNRMICKLIVDNQVYFGDFIANV